MKLKPIYNRLVVKRDATLTSSTLFIVEDKTKDRNELKPEGTVLAIGHDVHDVAVGDRVVFRKMSGTDVKVDGDDLLVMTEDDVIAIISDRPSYAALRLVGKAMDEAPVPQHDRYLTDETGNTVYLP